MCGLDVVLVNLLDHNQFDLNILGISKSLEASRVSEEERHTAVQRRGPDFSRLTEISDPEFHLSVFSSVLQIQGDQICSQPVYSDITGSMLCWNGEYLNHEPTGKSDTELIFSSLESGNNPANCLDQVEGPFSFVYYDGFNRSLWFGKDKIGRRSLLIQAYNSPPTITISSTYLPEGIEVPAGHGIYCIKLDSFSLEFHQWPNQVPFQSPSFLSSPSSLPMSTLYQSFRQSIGRHMTSTTVHAPLGILFSGGLDSVIMTSIAADLFLTLNHCLSEIHLINVATSTQFAPDRATGLVSYADLLTRFPSRIFKFIVVDIDQDELTQFEDRILNLASPNNSHMDFNISTALWFGGRGKGRILDSGFLNDPEWSEIRSKIILSESVESAVDNRTSKKPPIVSETAICSSCVKHKLKPGCVLHACKFCCKKSGSLCSVHGKRDTVRETSADPPNLIPFLSRYLKEPLTSNCRILLVGHGADEMFGGYGRHETRTRVQGVDGLRSEMVLDLSRLWKRNLGRDDRVLADHARDTRHPFLDEAIVDWVANANVESMISKNGSNKPVLRQLAREFLGMGTAANFRKRAIQFGTRLAQQTNIKCFGSHSRGSGTVEYSRTLEQN